MLFCWMKVATCDLNRRQVQVMSTMGSMAPSCSLGFIRAGAAPGERTAVTLLDLLKLDWTFLGLKAPRFAWVGGAVLLAFTLYQLGRLWYLVRRERRIHERIRKRLDGIRAEHVTRPGDGLSLVAYDAIARVFENAPSLRVAWDGIKAQILRQRGLAGTDEYWASESAEAAFNEAITMKENERREGVYAPGRPHVVSCAIRTRHGSRCVSPTLCGVRL